MLDMERREFIALIGGGVLLLAALYLWSRSRRADQGRDCGAAEIQRIAENAPRWPDINSLVQPSSTWPSSRSPCAILVWLEAL